ncbi:MULTISPECIES: acetyl/propionyl/methylcrotonyl-CoA carboxylase subunit alpha [unclassified Sphingomonas]|uniref:acetyl/propionyl/methylcrotonyl-CoA carboxylase subunit alpha n=1 Tax=unclassified Sphingomonas TaxID=196159 RepID=UPI000BCF6C8C|nr:MAG: methylcrotonoyl-CoA carboxylase [Sphingomonas sp. 12-62-6]OYX37254.1 MAG: methylcrotonoyl-CoA carboxylase [Sphingomonas sp. 32-62-10]
MIASLLIANRGEIACRIIRTARAMGVRTVAVYSDADAKALHVRQADEAVHIGPSPARESYLVGEKIIAAAKATGAEAIHPGYGFLSENADFAQAVIDAGLIWVGPRPDSIRAMGLKDAAKERMIAAGVPVTPGYLGADQSPDVLAAEADKIGYPVLIKAVAGGGGKGMRRVEAPADFADALASCKREAASSFGDDRVLIEKYILSPRHIEVQVFGDTHGNVIHLFERDCSLQRRHQKVIEEAPAPGMSAETRQAICAAAVRAAKAVDYVGAGTIEFIADASEGLRADRIWFMEMNTRLQVEHPVTEEITGVDLVEWQLRVASGEALPKRQDELSINGWAIEARLYAEDPARGFLPSVGKLEYLTLHAGKGRVETGVEQGDTVSPFYDPMIAKLIAYAAFRNEAIDILGSKLTNINVAPVRTNAGFLYRAAMHPEFRAEQIDTGFIARNLDALTPPRIPSSSALEQGLAVLRWNTNAYENEPWNGGLIGFRLGMSPRDQALVLVDGEPTSAPLGNLGNDLRVDEPADYALINEAGQTYRISAWRVSGTATGTAADGAILSPMPGRVTAVDVAAGDRVTKGQRLVTLEAMKMEHSLTAPFDGTVEELNATAGAQVSEGTVLVKVVRVEAAA